MNLPNLNPFNWGTVKPTTSESAPRRNLATVGARPAMSARQNASLRSPEYKKGLYHLLSADDVESLPDPEWLIEDVLPQGGLAILYGEPGAGKSFVALDWAASIASGEVWLGKEVSDGDVIYVYAEGVGGLKDRLRAWRIHHGVPLDRISFLPHPINLRDFGDVGRFADTIRSMGRHPKLIIIDTLARNFGDGDENAGKDMSGFIAGADELRRQFPPTTVVVVHHTGKDETKGQRGHSSLLGAADTVVKLSDNKSGMRLVTEKQKDAQEASPIPVRLKDVRVGNGKTSCVIALGVSTTPLAEHVSKSTQIALASLATFGAAGASYAGWMKRSGLASSTFKDTRKKLLSAGKVVQQGDYYTIGETGTEDGNGTDQPDAIAA